MPAGDSYSVLRSFLLIAAVTGMCVYTAYRLLQLRHVSLEDDMGPEDRQYFKDGVLINKETAEEQGVKSQPPKLSDKHEVKREADETAGVMGGLSDDDYVTNVMTDYNLDYSTTQTTMTPEYQEEVTVTGTDFITKTTTPIMSPDQTTSNDFITKTTTPILSPDQTTTSDNNLQPPKGSSYTQTPAPSSPPSRKPNTHLYTTTQVQKIAQEYFNSVTIQSTSEPAQKKSFTTTPRTSPTPTPGGLDSTRPRSTTPRPGRPKYTSYKIPTTTTLPPPCFRQPYKISEVCSLNDDQILVAGENVTLEDVAKMLFIKGTLSGLKDQCAPGVWCLEEDFELLNIMDRYLPFCGLQDCLLNMPDECINEERKLVLSTLFLFCSARRQNVTDECMFAVRKMAHVSMTDIYRTKFRRNENVCRDLADKDECNGTCQVNAQNLHCMSTVCNGSDSMFEEFDQWSWFFSLDDAENKCLLNNTDCTFFELELLYETWWKQLLKSNTFLGSVQDMDVKILVGMICAFMATMAVLVVLLLACVKKASRVYSRDKVQYAEIDEDQLLSYQDNADDDEVIEFHDEWDDLDPDSNEA